MLRAIFRFLRELARYAPTRRLALVVLVTSPVWLLSREYLFPTVTLALVALAILVDALRLPDRRSISVTRFAPDRIGVDDERAGHYDIASSWPVRLRATLTHQLPVAVTAPLAAAPLTLVQGEMVDVPFTITGRSRGVFALGPVALTVRTSWNLVRRSIVYSLSDQISVTPSVGRSGHYRLLAAQHRVRAAGQRAIRRRGTGTAFSNLRDYVPGDDPRHVDWKATARHNRLISREFTVEQGQTVMIAVDAGRMMTQLSGDRSRFEYALASALTLADVALSAGDRVGVMVFDSTVQRYVAPSRSPGTIGAIRDALVGVTATMTEPDYAAAFRTLTERNRRRSLIVLFTDVVDIRSSRALIALTARSAERHLPLVVALRNEQLAAAAVPHSGTDEQQVLTNVAAEELLSDREETLQSMRQAGVTVLDAAPETMTAALVNRYLEIKERSAL